MKSSELNSGEGFELDPDRGVDPFLLRIVSRLPIPLELLIRDIK